MVVESLINKLKAYEEQSEKYPNELIDAFKKQKLDEQNTKFLFSINNSENLHALDAISLLMKLNESNGSSSNPNKPKDNKSNGLTDNSDNLNEEIQIFC